jgi:hypothetical protein
MAHHHGACLPWLTLNLCQKYSGDRHEHETVFLTQVQCHRMHFSAIAVLSSLLTHRHRFCLKALYRQGRLCADVAVHAMPFSWLLQRTAQAPLHVDMPPAGMTGTSEDQKGMASPASTHRCATSHMLHCVLACRLAACFSILTGSN